MVTEKNAWMQSLPTGSAMGKPMIEFLSFIKNVPLTIRERWELRRWVRTGHSLTNNPWGYCDDRGYNMNFIDAYRRILEEEHDGYFEDDTYDEEEELPF